MPLLARYTVPQLIYGAIALLIVLALVVQTVRIEGFKIWPISHKGLKAELAEVSEKLQQISDRQNEQKQTTDRNVVETRVIIRDSGKAAERIEKAPTAPDCKTPEAIMGSSDL